MTRILFDDRVLLALFIVLGAYYLVGVFPLTPVFGDGIDVANGATHMSRTHIESTPLGYRYSQHPGAHVLLAIINRVSGADTHTVFVRLCAAGAARFVFVSGCLVSSVMGSWIGRAGVEYLLGKRWAFGGAINLATINVDWAGLKDRNDNPHLEAAIDMAINDFSIFARVRF